MRFLTGALLSLVAVLLVAGTANGQLIYNTGTVNNSTGNIDNLQLRQVNLDGSGNVPFAIGNVVGPLDPAFSNNGRLLAVSGKSSAQQNQGQISTNIFVRDTVTNQTRQLTNFTDTASGGNRLFHDATFKSFSPDGSRLAVIDRQLFINSVGQGDTAPFLSFHRVSDGQQLGAAIRDTNFNGSSTGGFGVSWSPIDDLIAVPRSTTSINPLLSGPTPISGFSSRGQLLNDLTSPTAGMIGGPFGEQFAEHDLLPSFSPNGAALAYFRFTRIGFGTNPAVLDLRITSPAGDRSILSFAQGQLPAGLSWSPDGTELAFGVGTQTTGIGGLRGFEAVASTLSIGTVNVDGSSPTPFLPAPAGFPEYFPGSIGSGNGDFDNDGDVDDDDVDFYIGNLGQSATGALAQLDLNGDGTITLADHNIHVTTLVQTSNGQTGTFPGDSDLDGQVDVFGDGFTLLANLGTSGKGWDDGDFNADGMVDVFGDGFTLLNNLGQSNGVSTTIATTAAVPEPNTLILLASATSCGLLRRRRS